jgi:hypothetical protein
MKSEKRDRQTIRPLDQQTELQKGNSALQILLQMTRRTALLEHNVSLERNHEHWEAGIVPAYIRHTAFVTVL